MRQPRSQSPFRLTNSYGSIDSTIGITLIEVLLLIMLITIMSSIVLSIYNHIPEKPYKIQEREDILLIKNALYFYKLDNGFYPTTQQGTQALIKKPKTPPIPKNWIQYLPALPQDPWGRSYLYKNPGEGAAIEVYPAPRS